MCQKQPKDNVWPSALSMAPSPERRGFMFVAPTDAIAWGEAVTIGWQLLVIPFAIVLAVSATMCRRTILGALVLILTVWVLAKPLTSATVFIVLIGSVAIAALLSSQSLTQGLLLAAGLPAALWLWDRLHHGLDYRDGYRYAAVVTTLWASAMGFVAYLPML